jgi:hypothetical protein
VRRSDSNAPKRSTAPIRYPYSKTFPPADRAIRRGTSTGDEPSFNGPDPPTEKFSRGVQSGKNGIFRGFRPPAPKRLEVTSCRFGRRCVSPSPAIPPKIVSIFAVVKMLRPFESRIFGKVRKRPKSKNRRFLGHPESDRRAVCCVGRQIETATRPP